MACIAITASMQRACSSHHATKKQPPPAGPARSFGTKQSTQFVTLDIEARKRLNIKEQEKSPLHVDKTEEAKQSTDPESCAPKFFDERWNNGTWDLNMFVKNGKMDWNGVIVAEARRRKFLELHPEAATNEEPVLYRSSVIPWWAWIMHCHLPAAELLNGRAAMIGFFAAYLVDVLTGLDVVGQTGNFICKAGLFSTVIGVLLFRRRDDLENLKKLADEATYYDNQWQASWKGTDKNIGNSEQSGKSF